MTACLILNVLLSAAIGHPGNMSHPGLVSFGQVGVRFLIIIILFKLGKMAHKHKQETYRQTDRQYK